MIRVSDTSDATVSKTSELFTLSDTDKYVFIIPDSLTEWQAGTQHDIVIRNTTNVDLTNAYIYLYKGGSYQTGISYGVTLEPDSNNITWDIDIETDTGSDYQLKLYYSGWLAITNNFSITSPPA